ncbi:hypothetical protein BJX96DRAFT_166174 [Aspergillus floccosus]
MDGVNDAASIATLVQLAAHIVHYLRTVIDAPVQKRKLLGALIQARGLLSTLVELTNEVEGEDWSYTIQSLSIPNGPLSSFRELLEHIARKLGVAPLSSNVGTAIRRLRWPFDQTSLQEMIDSLEKLKSHLLLAMANDHIRLSNAIRNELHQVQRQLAEASTRARRQAIVSLSKEEELIVDSLSVGNLWHELDGGTVMKMRAGAEWFLQHESFKQWRSSDSIPSTLVLTGRPGSGKSSICQVTRLLLKAWYRSHIDVCVAYFAFSFFQRSRDEEVHQSLVLSNIVQQILLERPYLMEHIATLGVTGGPLSSAESIDLISRARRDLKQFYLILDGLNESERTSRDVVKALLSIEPPLNILVAFRPSGALSETLKDCAMVCIDDAMALRHHYKIIKQRLEKDPRIAGYLDHKPENIAKAAKLIVEQSDGLYTYMNGLVKRLAQAETSTSFERLLHNRSLSLIEIYDLLFDDLMHQPAELATLAKKFLKKILNSGGRFTAVASARHLGRELTDIEMIEATHTSCKGFVSVSELSSGTWLQLVHLSARDFLGTRGVPE